MAFEWFRSWHGAPTDSKFLLIAKRAQVAPGMVSAVYWALLDYASQNEPRGSVEGFDIETYAEWAKWEERDVMAIIAALVDKQAIIDGRIAAWDKRQPKREDPGAADRMRKMRDAKRNADATQDESVTDASVTDSYDVLHDVTQSYSRLDQTRSDETRPETRKRSRSSSGTNGKAEDALIDPALAQALGKWQAVFAGTPSEAAPPVSMFHKWLAWYGPDVLCHMIGQAKDKGNPSGWLYTTYDNWRKDGEVAPYVIKQIEAARLASTKQAARVTHIINPITGEKEAVA